jgi:hypothetical protein
LKKKSKASPLECEYIVGDDSCRAVKESDMGALRAEKCQNENKDRCCYLCSLRRECDISCDLPIGIHEESNSEKGQCFERQLKISPDTEWECSNCIYYLKTKCPRQYERDEDLWRRQDPCDIFQPSKHE